MNKKDKIAQQEKINDLTKRTMGVLNQLQGLTIFDCLFVLQTAKDEITKFANGGKDNVQKQGN